MNEEKKRILTMLEEGKLSTDEAMMLMDQLGEKEAPPPVYHPATQAGKDAGRMFRVRVVVIEDGSSKPVNVNINLPIKAARIAGRMVMNMMPDEAMDAMSGKGIDLSDMDLDAMLDALEDTGGDIVNINTEDEDSHVTVRVYVE